LTREKKNQKKNASCSESKTGTNKKEEHNIILAAHTTHLDNKQEERTQRTHKPHTHSSTIESEESLLSFTT
jgi:hypothetical protein